MGHQALDRTLSLLRERVYWPTMAQETSEWIKGCRHCHIAKSDYNEPKPKLGNLIANNPLDLLCIDFTKVDPSRTGKENVLVMTDAFTKFSQAIVTSNQKALTVAKVLVDKWFHVDGIPAWIHSDQGKLFDNEILDHLCAMYGVERTMTAPYDPQGNSQCERFNRTMFNLLKTLSKEQKSDWPAHLTMTFSYNATPHSSTGFQPYDLGITQEEEQQLREAEFATGADPVPSAPVYIPKLKKSKKKKINHDYALRSLGPVADAKVASVELQSTRL